MCDHKIEMNLRVSTEGFFFPQGRNYSRKHPTQGPDILEQLNECLLGEHMNAKRQPGWGGDSFPGACPGSSCEQENLAGGCRVSQSSGSEDVQTSGGSRAGWGRQGQGDQYPAAFYDWLRLLHQEAGTKATHSSSFLDDGGPGVASLMCMSAPQGLE